MDPKLLDILVCPLCKGPLVYRKAQRNFNVVMATAARTTIAEVSEIVELGGVEAEAVVTPCIFVHRLVKVPAMAVGRDGGT